MTPDDTLALYLLSRSLWWRHDLEQLDAEAVAAVIVALEAAQKDIASRLAAEAAGLATLSDWRREQDEALNAWADEVLAGARATITGTVSEASIAAAAASLAAYNAILTLDGKASAVKSVGLTSAQVVSWFQDTALGSGGLEHWVDTALENGVKQSILAALRQVAVEGKGTAEAVRRVLVAASDAGFELMRREAITITRTFIQTANVNAQEAVYKANRKHSRKHHRICRCAHFLRWVVKQFKEHKWSLDSCVGYARLHGLFPADEMVCTRTLYNEVWAGNLDLSVTELPEAMKRKQHKDSKPREHKKSFGTDISQRPEIAALRIEEGHWEGDTVVGKRAGKEAVVLSLLEKKTENYIAIQIPGKDADSVLNAMQSLREEFGDKFSQVFKTITVDNGSEFSTFSLVENWGSAVYFAHPYTSWERPQNERHNGLFRAFVPKGASIESFSPEYILSAADELNGRPRKKLGYRTPEELFDEFLDSVYAASGCGSIAQNGSQRLPS